MKRSHVLVSAAFATLLLCIPVQSQAFFGFFGGGFSFGFGGGWSGWGGPGWWGPGYWGGYPGGWGGPGYWHGPYRYRWGYPHLWRRFGDWGYPNHGWGLPYLHAPPVAAQTPKAPEAAREK